MTYRVYVNVSRGIMDATSVCVFPWEVPILEEIHGESAQLATPEDMAKIRGAASIKEIRMPYNPDADKLKPLGEALVDRLRVDSEDDPFRDLNAEYDRLVNLYGMDKELPMPVVKKVYGSPAQFRVAVQQYKRGALPPANIEELIKGSAVNEDEAGDDDHDASLEDRPLDDLDLRELQKLCKQRDVKIPRNATRLQLIDLLVEKLAEAA